MNRVVMISNPDLKFQRKQLPDFVDYVLLDNHRIQVDTKEKNELLRKAYNGNKLVFQPIIIHPN